MVFIGVLLLSGICAGLIIRRSWAALLAAPIGVWVESFHKENPDIPGGAGIILGATLAAGILLGVHLGRRGRSQSSRPTT
jgi:hypothetical protein